MIDGNLLTIILPPLFAAVVAYAIAKVKSNAHVRIQQAKLEAEIDSKAMEMVKNIVDTMKNEMKEEIQNLKKDNESLHIAINNSKEEIESLRQRLRASSELQDAMKQEIISLKNTIQWYETKLRELDKPSTNPIDPEI